MSYMRFSAAPAGRLSDRTIPWVIFGERPEVPDGLEDSALAGANLAQIASSPGAPMFEHESLFGAHVAAQDLSLDKDDPVVVFVHGFQHEPRRPVLPRARSDNPHRCLYHFTETPAGPGSKEERTRHITPWFSRAMTETGEGTVEDCRGLPIGFSYASWGGSADTFLPGVVTDTLTRYAPKMRLREPSKPFINAYSDAEVAGYGLAAVLTQIEARLDHAGLQNKKIDIVAHSLGAWTTLSALALIAQRWPNDTTLTRIDRVILMGGACYWGQAAFALANIVFADAPEGPSFYNVMTRSDNVLRYLRSHRTMAVSLTSAEEDLSIEKPVLSMLRSGQTIGFDGKPPHKPYEFFGDEFHDWVDIRLDSMKVRRWGTSHGFDLRGARSKPLGDHWVHFTHPGNWALYRAILHDRENWSVDSVKAALED